MTHTKARVLTADQVATGSIVKVCSLPSKERVGVLLSFLGKIRKVIISENDLIF